MKGKTIMPNGYKVGDAIYQMNSAEIGGFGAKARFHNWLVRTHFGDLSQEEKDKLKNYPPDALGIIANWAYAYDIEHVISNMTPEQKTKETEETFDRGGKYQSSDKAILTYEDLVHDEISLESWIRVTDQDEDYGPVLRRVVNKQLKEALDHWAKIVNATVQYGYAESYEPYSRPDEFCDLRDRLEYVKAGIEMLRLEDLLEDLPYYKEYCKRLKELDVPFRKLLNGETVVRPYADKHFWWRQPSSKK